MEPLAIAAGAALVSAMTTNVWHETRAAVLRWWRKFRPSEADSIKDQLDADRGQLVTALQNGNVCMQQTLAERWQSHLEQLLAANPAAKRELSALLQDCLISALPDNEQASVSQVLIKAEARGRARQNISGNDMHITETT